MGCSSRRKEKKDRQSQQHWADGIRETILAKWVSPMADAMAQTWQVQDEVLRSCTNEYHTKVDWHLEDHEEPTLPLPDYDPKKPPPQEELSDEEMAPRQGYQQYMHEAYGEDADGNDKLLKKKVLEAFKEEKNSKPNLKFNVTYKGIVCNRIFKTLLTDEQKRYKERASTEAVKGKLEFENALKAPVSEKPEDIQRCIDNLLGFIAPIIRGVSEMTKLQCFFTAGGMIPKAGGEIGTKHYLVGSNPVTGVPFTRWKDNQFDSNVLAPFKEYLEGVYPKKEREAAALREATADKGPLDEAIVGLGDRELGEAREEQEEEGDRESTDSGSSGSNNSDVEEQDAGQQRKRKREEKQIKRKPPTRSQKRTLQLHRENPCHRHNVVPDQEQNCPHPMSADGEKGKEMVRKRDGEQETDVNPELICPIPSAEVLAMVHESDVDFTDLEFVAAWTKAKAGEGEGDGEVDNEVSGESIPDPEEMPEPPWVPEPCPADSPKWFRPLFDKFASVEFLSYKCS
ncbi:hypothetical protein C8J56DRAFT_904927 [Mycena floridula]|nr:hypothetical protein C8J56DRAFT_904927 [Mycena floridula]